MVPLFALPSTAGGSAGPGSLRSKYSMVLAFLGEIAGGEAYLRALARLYPELLAEGARLFAVVALDLAAAGELAGMLSLPYPLLADAGGSVTTRMMGSESAALCVADRYGEVVYLYTASEPGSLPAPDVALEWLAYVGMQCPE